MNRIDETRAFIPVNIAVLTVSDTRTEKTDKSGDVLASMIAEAGHHLADRAIVTDDAKAVRKQVKKWIKDPEIDVVITTGGTGFSERDVTPEAVRPLFEKEIDGFSALFHMLSYKSVGTSTVQSRACGGLVRRHLYFLRAGFARGMRGRLERHPQTSTRQSPPALQLSRGHAPARDPLEGQAESLTRFRLDETLPLPAIAPVSVRAIDVRETGDESDLFPVEICERVG